MPHNALDWCLLFVGVCVILYALIVLLFLTNKPEESTHDRPHNQG
jgi:hypothetical protein